MYIYLRIICLFNRVTEREEKTKKYPPSTGQLRSGCNGCGWACTFYHCFSHVTGIEMDGKQSNKDMNCNLYETQVVALFAMIWTANKHSKNKRFILKQLYIRDF